MRHLNADHELRDRLRTRARTMCLDGIGYKQICEELGVSKGTLSGWCSDLVQDKQKTELTQHELNLLSLEFAKDSRSYNAARKLRLPIKLVLPAFAELRKAQKLQAEKDRRLKLAEAKAQRLRVVKLPRPKPAPKLHDCECVMCEANFVAGKPRDTCSSACLAQLRSMIATDNRRKA